MVKEITDYKESLACCLSFSPRDWSVDHRDAWVYEIIIGWGDALPEVAARHGWDARTLTRLTAMHVAFKQSGVALNILQKP